MTTSEERLQKIEDDLRDKLNANSSPSFASRSAMKEGPRISEALRHRHRATVIYLVLLS